MSKQSRRAAKKKTVVVATNCPIDENPLKKMFGDDPRVIKEILDDFMLHTIKTIREIKAGWENRSAEEVEMAAHKLKSSAKSVGAFELGDICSKMELAGTKNDLATIDQYIPLLDAEMNKVEQYIKNI